MPNVPLIDLQAQYRTIKADIDRAIQRVLDSGQFILGAEVEALEQEVAVFCGTKYAVAVASGTDALVLSLRARGIKAGQEVITTAYSFFATTEAILAVGAIPVFVDIDVKSYTIDPEQVARAVSPRTTAIIPVHLYGHPCAMDRLMAIAKTHRLTVIEDCAQAIGAQFQGTPVGSFGDAAALSFYPSKNLGGYGDGGMVVTNDATLAEQVRLLRAHGSRERYQHVAVGMNSRLDELQAAILRVKLQHLEAWNDARRHRARLYHEAFHRHQANEIILPQELPLCSHVYHLYSIRLKEREKVQAHLAQQGIATQVAYPSTIPSQPALASSATRAEPCPNAEQVAQEILSLPMYPELTPALIDRVVSEIVRARS